MYPDMRLYQEIVFLQHNACCSWAVENVKPYYKPIIEPDAVMHRHFFWSNFRIPSLDVLRMVKIRHAQIPDLEKALGFSLKEFKLENKRQVLRNCVDPQLGLHILESARENFMQQNFRLSNKIKSVKIVKNGKGIR
ncbi:hypothetical protein D3C85_1367540 [compost metagenome]